LNGTARGGCRAVCVFPRIILLFAVVTSPPLCIVVDGYDMIIRESPGCPAELFRWWGISPGGGGVGELKCGSVAAHALHLLPQEELRHRAIGNTPEWSFGNYVQQPKTSSLTTPSWLLYLHGSSVTFPKAEAWGGSIPLTHHFKPPIGLSNPMTPHPPFLCTGSRPLSHSFT